MTSELPEMGEAEAERIIEGLAPAGRHPRALRHCLRLEEILRAYPRALAEIERMKSLKFEADMQFEELQKTVRLLRRDVAAYPGFMRKAGGVEGWINKIFGKRFHRHNWIESRAFDANTECDIWLTVIIGLQCECGARSLKYLTPPQYLGQGALQPALNWLNHLPKREGT